MENGIEKFVLKKFIIDSPERPSKYSFNQIYRFFDYKLYSESDVRAIVDKLVEKEIVLKLGDSFSLSRETFIKLRNKYKFIILLQSNKSIFPIIAGLFAMLFTFLGHFNNSNIIKSEKEMLLKKTFENEIRDLNVKLKDFYKSTPIEAKYNAEVVTVEIKKLKQQSLELSENVNSLNSLLEENPRKFVEIAAMKRDIDDLRKEILSNHESLKREMDRISSYNNTLIAFMITFLVAYIGIGVFNLIVKNKSSTI